MLTHMKAQHTELAAMTHAPMLFRACKHAHCTLMLGQDTELSRPSTLLG